MRIEPLFSEEEIRRAVQELAVKVLARFGSTEPVMVLALLNGATWFAADLLRQLPCNYMLETLRVSSYMGTESSGSLRWRSPLPDCRGKRVLLLDDVLDSGLTMQTLLRFLQENGAKECATAVAVDKEGRRAVEIVPDFAALHCGNRFLVGYGLDYDGRFRNLPYIGELFLEA